MLAAAWEHARRQRLLIGVAYAGLAYVEWAWLAGEPEVAHRVAAELLPRPSIRAALHSAAELLRYLARAGLPAEPFAGCPEPCATGLRGDWRAAAAAGPTPAIPTSRRSSWPSRASRADARGPADPRRPRRRRRAELARERLRALGAARAAAPARARARQPRRASPSASWPCWRW